MAKLKFGELWEAARTLSIAEQERLRELLNALLARKGERLSADDEFAIALLRDGIISEIPPPLGADDLERHRNWEPIKIEGKPLSETIIEERR
jgi:hypothetical protein